MLLFFSKGPELMPMLFVVEDSVRDMRTVEDAARSVGFRAVIGDRTVRGAITRLSTTASDSSVLPAAFLIDLDLGDESGYEFLRFRHNKQELARIPAVVWTHLDTHHQELCDLFGIQEFVDKGDGLEALTSALRKVLPNDEPLNSNVKQPELQIP